MESTARGLLGLGVTLLVFAAAMGTVNGLARAWGTKTLARNPNNQWAQAVLTIYG